MSPRPIIAVALFLLAIRAHAEDLNTIGPTYEIIERDLLKVIQDRFRRMEKTGERVREVVLRRFDARLHRLRCPASVCADINPLRFMGR